MSRRTADREHEPTRSADYDTTPHSGVHILLLKWLSRYRPPTSVTGYSRYTARARLLLMASVRHRRHGPGRKSDETERQRSATDQEGIPPPRSARGIPKELWNRFRFKDKTITCYKKKGPHNFAQ